MVRLKLIMNPIQLDHTCSTDCAAGSERVLPKKNLCYAVASEHIIFNI